ncbi:MAG: hypothetical protein WCK93_13230, partial [Nitrosomonadales bacterium]
MDTSVFRHQAKFAFGARSRCNKWMCRPCTGTYQRVASFHPHHAAQKINGFIVLDFEQSYPIQLFSVGDRI